MSNNKICSKCLEIKDLFKFQVQNNVCISCKNKKHYDKDYYKIYYAKHKEDMHKKYLDNSDAIKARYKARYHELCELQMRPKKGRGRPSKKEIEHVDIIETLNEFQDGEIAYS